MYGGHHDITIAKTSPSTIRLPLFGVGVKEELDLWCFGDVISVFFCLMHLELARLIDMLVAQWSSMQYYSGILIMKKA